MIFLASVTFRYLQVSVSCYGIIRCQVKGLLCAILTNTLKSLKKVVNWYLYKKKTKNTFLTRISLYIYILLINFKLFI